MKLVSKFEKELERVNADNLPTLETIAALIELRGALISMLKAIKWFTGKKADATIDKIIAWLKNLTPTA